MVRRRNASTRMANNVVRATTQFMFNLERQRRNYVVQLFPSGATNKLYSIFQGLSPGMVIRVTRVMVTVANTSTPGGFQWHDDNLSLLGCDNVDTASSTEFSETRVDAEREFNDGTRHGPVVTIGVNATRNVVIPMGTGGQFTELRPTRNIVVDDTTIVSLGHVLGHLSTTGLDGVATVSITYQIGVGSSLDGSHAIGTVNTYDERTAAKAAPKTTTQPRA